MKRLIVCTALIAISLQGKVFAQEKNKVVLTRTQSNFNIDPKYVNHRHWVYLPKDEKMIIETHYEEYYSLLSNLDSILAIVMHDISFYKDSLAAAGSVRIDYAFTANPAARKIRFKKYEPDGELFINNQNELSKLKIDQDTLRILFLKPRPDKVRGYSEFEHLFAIQVTFCLNNYTDIDMLLHDKGMLNHIIDTLAITSKPKHTKQYYSTIKYNPSDTSHYDFLRFRKYNYVFDDEKDMMKSQGTLQINGSLGVGIIRNVLSPMAEMGIEINDRWRVSPKKFTFFRLSATPYFFFERTSLNHIAVYDNWFANLELGTQLKDKRNSVGVGYLFAEKGGYFQNTTMKAYISFTLSKHFILCPEIIFTNNFKQVFPGVTLRF